MEPNRRQIPEEILYDRMKTVWLGSDERGEIIWHPVFLDFARYWGTKTFSNTYSRTSDGTLTRVRSFPDRRTRERWRH
jgi:hypothetical protein